MTRNFTLPPPLPVSPSNSFPADFYPERIVDFKLPHNFLMLEKPFKKFVDLTFINLSKCQSIPQIPDVSTAINLRVLTLERCHNVVRFNESILFMLKLVCLSASKCTMLKSFVSSMYFLSLEVLSFNLCKRLEHFPEVMQKVDTPLKIWMIGPVVKRFTNSNGNLTGLEYIDMSFCRRRSDLPSSFLLPKLASLRIDGCSPPEPPNAGSRCLMTSPSPSANHQPAEIKFVKTNYACFVAKESEKDLVEWNASEGAMKHTYHGLGKRSTSVGST